MSEEDKIDSIYSNEKNEKSQELVKYSKKKFFYMIKNVEQSFI